MILFKKPNKDIINLKWKVYKQTFYITYLLEMVGLFYFASAGVIVILGNLFGVVLFFLGAVAYVMSNLFTIYKQNSYLIKKLEGLE